MPRFELEDDLPCVACRDAADFTALRALERDPLPLPSPLCVLAPRDVDRRGVEVAIYNTSLNSVLS